METKINIPGKLAYESLLLKEHRREVHKFLQNERVYTNGQISTIMKYYDAKINHKNILAVHTHATIKFLTALCTGELESLYGNTSCKSFIKSK